MASGMKKSEDGIKIWLNGVLNRKGMVAGYLNRVTYPRYQQAQLNRWTTENASEGNTWQELSPAYAARKKIIYGGGPKFQWVGGSGEGRPWAEGGQWPTYPGSGRAVMIATGKLVAAVSADGPGVLKIVTSSGMTVGIDDVELPYGKFAAETRPFMEFSAATLAEMTDGLADYLMMGRE